MNKSKYFVSRIAFISVVLVLQLPVLYAQNKPVQLKPIDEQRVNEIALLLPEKPAGFGDPCCKRDVWDQLLKSGKYNKFLKKMESFTFPPFIKEDYFSFSEGTASSSSRRKQMMLNRAKGLSQATGMMGEVVGIAAFLSIENNCAPRDIYQNHLTGLKVGLQNGVPQRNKPAFLPRFH